MDNPVPQGSWGDYLLNPSKTGSKNARPEKFHINPWDSKGALIINPPGYIQELLSHNLTNVQAQGMAKFVFGSKDNKFYSSTQIKSQLGKDPLVTMVEAEDAEKKIRDLLEEEVITFGTLKKP